MNILTNPGFESGEAPWQFGSGSALLEDGSGRGGGNCAWIIATKYSTSIPPNPPVYTTISGSIMQVPPWELGTLYFISGYAKSDAPWGSLSLTCAARPVLAWGDDVSPDWEVRYGLFYADLPGSQLFVRAGLGLGTGGASWLVDDLSVEIGGWKMSRSLYNSYSALFTRLKDINGSTGGYYNNISTQVVPKLVLPSEPGAPKMPYVCLPLSDTGSYQVEERSVRAALRQSIIAFVPESESMEVSECSAVKALKMHDDIVKCLMPEEPSTVWNLGNSHVEDVALLSKEVVAGQNDGIPWAEVNVTVDVYTRFARQDLGPNA